MHETPAEIETLQARLDRSYERAGAHLREVTTAEGRLDADRMFTFHMPPDDA